MRLLTTVRARWLAITVASSAASCGTTLNLPDYSFRPDNSDSATSDSGASDVAAPATLEDAESPSEASIGREGASDAPADTVADATNCNVDLASQCYPCTPVAPAQLVNACTSSTCVPFDDSTRVTHLLPDGALPPLPPNTDAGDN
jgi:hypothetical protein